MPWVPSAANHKSGLVAIPATVFSAILSVTNPVFPA